MREIKFEVFDNFNKYICIPFLFEKSTESDRIGEDDRFNAPYIYYATATDYIEGVRRPCFIREFTGLRDATGKDIYEGDILEFDEKEWGCKHIFEVKYDKYSGFVGSGTLRDWGVFCKIIGNIYENPELLEQGRGKNNN